MNKQKETTNQKAPETNIEPITISNINVKVENIDEEENSNSCLDNGTNTVEINGMQTKDEENSVETSRNSIEIEENEVKTPINYRIEDITSKNIDDNKTISTNDDEMEDDENNISSKNNEIDDNKEVPANDEMGDADDDEDYDDVNDKNYDGIKEKKNSKLKINTHQCYICYKLFETKSKLIDHCKIHFDVCSDRLTLKKCPLCEYVTDLTITRHLKLAHNITLHLPYNNFTDKTVNSDKSRYVYNINNSAVKEIEIIPSVPNLNKRAYVEIDRKNRKNKDLCIAKSKLVKKGGEWVVEQVKMDVHAGCYLLPKFKDEDVLKIKDPGNTYLEKLKTMGRLAKKTKSKMLYPCEGCDKMCRTFAALKLHSRRHEKNPKPFKKKVWKHKLESKIGKKRTKPVQTKHKPVTDNVPANSNRFAFPKPIVNNHKCDDKLKEFYEKNIKGEDIEFWQFLKIYNRMDRENIKDFKDLENRTDFGIHEKTDMNYVNNLNVNKPKPNINKTNDKNKKFQKTTNNKIVKNKYVRIIRISKREHLKRLEIIKKLRQNIAEAEYSRIREENA